YRLAARSTSQLHFVVFWIGFLTALMAMLFRGLSAAVGRGERTRLLVVFGLVTFVPKFVMSVNSAVYRDEFPHWGQVNAMASSGGLDPSNSSLPIVHNFPGLELVTLIVHDVTRLSTWHSGQIVVLAAHCMSLLLVASIARAVGATDAGAFLAALVFGLNPSFTYFDVQYAYESLALPLALAAILGCIRARRGESGRQIWSWAAVGGAAAASCTVTHHVSSIFAAGMCVAIAALVPVRLTTGGVDRAARMAGWAVALIATVLPAIWLTVVAKGVGPYLLPHFTSAWRQLLQVVGLRSAPPHVGTATAAGTAVAPPASHALFSGSTAPDYERLAAVLAPGIIFALVALGAYTLWTMRRNADQIRLAAPFAILATAFFLSLPFALTASGGEIAHRSWAFSYVGIAIITSFSLHPSLGARFSALATRRASAIALGTALAIVAVGNIAAGENVLYRFPGPYEFGTDTRSATAEQRAAVEWLGAHAPRGTAVVTDRFTAEAVTAYTFLKVPDPNQSGVFGIYSRPELPAPSVRAVLRAGKFEYFILDERIDSQLPAEAFFAGYHTYAVINSAALRNLTPSDFLSPPVYVSTHYAIYKIAP
ncbi:MAG TPA: hypothetical protein VK662_00870, partial [Acidothermaceae bacterium]|nr:hypothetical protein [Acidothermaceae bacterium]